MEIRIPNKELDTETIDRLFLELSQFTRAETKKELELKNALKLLHLTILENRVYTTDMQKHIKELLLL